MTSPFRSRFVVVACSTLGVDADEAKRQAFHFSKLLDATRATFNELGTAMPEVVSLVAPDVEHVLSLGPSSVGGSGECFFITTRVTSEEQ